MARNYFMKLNGSLIGVTTSYGGIVDDDSLINSNLQIKFNIPSASISYSFYVNSLNKFVLFSTSGIHIADPNTGVINTYSYPVGSTLVSYGEAVVGHIYFAMNDSNIVKIYSIDVSNGVISLRYNSGLTPTSTALLCTGQYLVISNNTLTTAHIFDAATNTLFYTKAITSSINRLFSNGNFTTSASSTIVKTPGADITITSLTTPVQLPGVRSFGGSPCQIISGTAIYEYDLTTYEPTLLRTSLSISATTAINSRIGVFSAGASVNSGIWDATLKTFRGNLPLGVAAPQGIGALNFNYKHTVNLNETLTANTFKVLAFDRSNFNLVKNITITSPTGDITLPDNDQYLIVVFPDIGSQFKITNAYSLNDKVYPKNTTQFPYYFICTTAGTSGLVEPSWNTTVGGTTATGSAVFTVVEQIPNVSSKFPILPEPVA